MRESESERERASSGNSMSIYHTSDKFHISFNASDDQINTCILYLLYNLAYIYTVVLWCSTKDNVSQTEKENIHGAMFALLSPFSVYKEYIFAESQRRLLKIF